MIKLKLFYCKTIFNVCCQSHTVEGNMNRVLAGKYAFITTQFLSNYLLASRYMDPHGYSPVHISSTTYPKFAGTSWGVR